MEDAIKYEESDEVFENDNKDLLWKMLEKENEEHVESEEDYECEVSEHDADEDIINEIESEEKYSEDNLNGIEETIRMHDGWCCCCFAKVCRKWIFERN